MARIIIDLAAAKKTRVLDIAGGPARPQVILVLVAVLGLDTAQLGTLSAVSVLLKRAFHISNTQIGLLLAIVSFVGLSRPCRWVSWPIGCAANAC
jgi:hypothetical protein